MLTYWYAVRIFFGRHFRDFQKAVQLARWRRRGVNIAWQAMLQLDSHAELGIGPGSTIGPYTVVNMISDPVRPGRSRLEIGTNTAINEFNNIRAGGASVRIGNNCLFSQYVSVIGINHTVDNITVPIREAAWDRTHTDVHVGDDVWIGTGAVILPGVKIGDGAVIAAGAVVTRDIPPKAIAAGVPASVLRFRKP